VVQRCQVHKIRNVTDHLPQRMRPMAAARMRDAYRADSWLAAKTELVGLAEDLAGHYPDAAASLREGLEETLTVTRLRLPDTLKRGLATTNAIENLNSVARDACHNVKRWDGQAMVLRWMAAAILDVQPRFHKIKGYEGLAGVVL